MKTKNDDHYHKVSQGVDSILQKNIKENNQQNTKSDTTIQCHHCNAMITIEKTKNDKITIHCPSCKKKLNIGHSEKKKKKSVKKIQHSLTSNVRPKILKSKKGKPHHKISHRVHSFLQKNIKENNQQNTKSDTTIQCHHCNTMITIEKTKNDKITIRCPSCKKKLKIKPLQKKKKISIKKIQTLLTSNIVELVLIFFGISFLLNPTFDNIKISLTLILIGSILLFFMSNTAPLQKENKNDKHSLHFKKDKKGTLIRQKTNKIFSNKYVKNMVNSLSDKIAIILIFWTLLLFVITSGNQVEIFFILIFIGFLITRELTDDLASITLKHRLDGFIVVFLVAYVIVISEKIINILNM